MAMRRLSKESIMLRPLVFSFSLFLFLALAPQPLNAAPAQKDCVSALSGPWSDPSIWSNCDGAAPGAEDNVFLQAGHVVTLGADTAVGDFNLNVSTGATGYARLELQSYILDLHGKLRAYQAPVGTIPGTASTGVMANMITRTPGSSGRLRVVGGTRVLAAAAEWGSIPTGASPSTFAIEIAADPSAVLTLATVARASSWLITSGTLLAEASLYADCGVAGGSDFTIAQGGVLASAASTPSKPSIARSASARGGTLTVDGLLKLTGGNPRVNMTTIALNNTVEFAGEDGQTLLQPVVGSFGQYTHVVLSGSGAKTLTANTTISGSLTRSDTATLARGAYTLSYGADVELRYTGPAQQVTGAEAPTSGVGGLRIDSAAGVKLSAPLTVTGKLTLHGDLDAASAPLYLGPAITCQGSGDVLGTLVRTSLASGGSFCFGDPNFLLNFDAGAPPQNVTVTLTRGSEPFGGAVLRLVKIDAEGGGGNTRLRLPYRVLDLNGNDPQRLHLWRYDGAHWALQVAETRGTGEGDAGKDYVEKTVTAFTGQWALADGGAPTAVTVSDFAAKLVEGRLEVRWQTASELDCLGFALYRSHSPSERGAHIADVPAELSGSPAGADYRWEDPQPPAPGAVIYYWLDIFDQREGRVPNLQAAVIRMPTLYLPVLSN
jgi:hypothetical protein